LLPRDDRVTQGRLEQRFAVRRLALTVVLGLYAGLIDQLGASLVELLAGAAVKNPQDRSPSHQFDGMSSSNTRQALGIPPLIMTPVDPISVQRGYGDVVVDFIGEHFRHAKDGIAAPAGSLIELRQFQRNIAGCVYARREDERYVHRMALIGLPRKNGKSELGSSFALFGLLGSGDGAEVYSCAADKEQARIVFGVAKRMVELDPGLSDIIKCYRDALEVTQTGSVYKVLSSEAFTKEGLNPSVVLYDELHAAPNPELFNVMTLAQGARKNPLLIAITTAGVKTDQTGEESTCYRLYQHGEAVARGEAEDPTFFMAWWGAPKGADHTDPEVWKMANPGYGDFLDPEDFQASLQRVHENEFRTKRLNQWVDTHTAWLPAGAWDACRTDRDFVPTAHGVVLGFDGSQRQDTTALVAVTISNEPMVKVLGLWQKPPDDVAWQVPRGAVKDAIRQACRDYNVVEIAWDEWIWQDAAEELTDEGLPVVIFPQNMTRMSPATQRFYEAVTNGNISHDGDAKLASHLRNCNIKTDSRGSRIVKDSKNSPRKIDLAVAAVMAFDRAAFYLFEGRPGTYKWTDPSGATHSTPVKDIKFVW
jgi:phage terminase large subunit-like protein